MYHYETLGDQRFQELCQALIAIEHPSAQCLPVGQPDGGRDAFFHRAMASSAGGSRELVVFQVKYSKASSSDRSAREMILDVVRTEKKKVDRLKSLGLRKYLLITNVAGTAHLGSGSIDKVNDELSHLLGIESYCWWRDDIDRRLDAASGVKWSYPEVLKATDLLETLIRGSLGEDEERRRNAIRAYMTAQYDDDSELKFKQTDLRSTMTDLFVDLPMSESEQEAQDEIVNFNRNARHYYRGNLRPHFYYYRESHHAANFLLSEAAKDRYSKILLEGAPGQGKSTVTQYACQVLRMLMLDKTAELEQLPSPHRTFMARIPFRVDLRDLAKWLGGTDPFQSKVAALDDREPKSLEGFLAGQIRHASGGANFNVSDLIAVAKASHLFLALDGFDEVADVTMRNTLVTEISKAIGRLQNAGEFTVQAVVTSRPAAFAKSVRFPRDQWAYFQLLPLERTHVDAYTTKWMQAKSLKHAERLTLVRVLNEKLEEAHTQYLAKNPMQLTILLSLINNRGSSLPEKRTAMYDAYMDMFFSRESEKSDIVRDNRELIIDIHRFLAWKLQTGAEGGGDGSIEYNELRSTLFTYLDSQGEDTSVVNALFNGIIERVGALVSRVLETYEFEVQPLREYFAARHLYETAPYSPVGEDHRGTKLDRFQALVRNPYWLNVARFYGGCFSKGEVSALVDELNQIAGSGDYHSTSHPRMVALMFLSDWVFTQYQPAVKRVVELICEKPELKQLLAAEQAGTLAWSPLPDRSGKQEFVDRLWERFSTATKRDERQALARALGQNSTNLERASLWLSLAKSQSLGDWISTGALLGVFRGSPALAIQHLPNPPPAMAVRGLLDAGHFEILAGSTALQTIATEELRRGLHTPPAVIQRRHSSESDLSWTARILSLYQYGLPFSDSSGAPLYHVLESRLSASSTPAPKTEDEISPSTVTAKDGYQAFVTLPTPVLKSSTKPWSDLVECLRSAWGDCCAVDRIALIAAGVHARGESGVAEALAETTDLTGSFRYLRMKSGAPKWWMQTLSRVVGTPDLCRYLLALWVWGTPRTLLALSTTVDAILSGLSQSEWECLQISHRYCQAYSTAGTTVDQLSRSDIQSLNRLSSRTAVLLGTRLSGDVLYRVVRPILSDSQASEVELDFALELVLRAVREEPKWSPMLSDIRELYSRGGTARSSPRRDELPMPKEVAEEVLASLELYPLPLIAAADTHVKAKVGERTPKLLDVAKKEGWF